MLERHIDLDDEMQQFLAIIHIYPICDFVEACRVVKNAYAKTARMKKRIASIFDEYDEPVFVTWTLNDEHLYLSMRTLQDKLKSICNSFCHNWVFNVDYGRNTGRLHFHGVLGYCDAEKLCSDWPYGFVYVEMIHKDDTDLQRLSRYCTKLARHATKYTAEKVTYSRLKKGKHA